jgi:hypothetical protein
MSELKQEVYTFEDLNNRFEIKFGDENKTLLKDFIPSIKSIKENELIVVDIFDKDTGERYEESFDNVSIDDLYYPSVFIKNIKIDNPQLESIFINFDKDLKITRITVNNEVIHTTSNFPIFQMVSQETLKCDWYYKNQKGENITIAKVENDSVEIYSESFVFSFEKSKQNETFQVRNNNEKLGNTKIPITYIMRYLVKQPFEKCWEMVKLPCYKYFLENNNDLFDTNLMGIILDY